MVRACLAPGRWARHSGRSFVRGAIIDRQHQSGHSLLLLVQGVSVPWRLDYRACVMFNKRNELSYLSVFSDLGCRMNMMMRHALPLLEMDVLRLSSPLPRPETSPPRGDGLPHAFGRFDADQEARGNARLHAVFARRPSVSLTPKGELLLGYARRLLCLNNETVVPLPVARHERVWCGSVRRRTSASEILPDVLKRFGRDVSERHHRRFVGMSNAMRKRVDEHRLDIAVFNSLSEDSAKGAEILMQEKLVWQVRNAGTRICAILCRFPCGRTAASGVPMQSRSCRVRGRKFAWPF